MVELAMEEIEGKSRDGGGFEGGDERRAQEREVWKRGGV